MASGSAQLECDRMKNAREWVKRDRRGITGGVVSLAAIALLFVLAAYLFDRYEPDIEQIVGGNSLVGMTLYVLVFIVSIVFAPISAMPLIPIGTRLWGVGLSAVLSVVGWTIGAMIAFDIARRFGRPYVSKLISLDKIEKVEKYMPEEHIFWTIFFFRAVTPVDGLSYALGLLTRVHPRVFFWATLLGLIPFCLAVSYLGSLPPVYLAAGLILAGVFCALGMIRVQRRHG